MPSSDPVHVLVVDDDRHVQRMLADALTKQGFVVTVERDGESALRSLETKPFELVLLDVLLPALNGYEVARRIKSSPRGEKTAVVLLSGIYKSKLQQIDAVERHGATAFVEKPFKLEALFEKLRAVLGDRFPGVGRPLRADPPSALPAAEEAAEADSTPVHADAGAHRGSFAERAFPELLADLHLRRATGALLLRREKVKKIVYLRSGLPESVKSNRLSECLGRVMVRERMISVADCDESLRRMKSTGRQQGTVLVEMGCISPHNLRYALDLQLRLKLVEVFGWTAGEWQFNPRAELPPTPESGTPLPPAALILEGVRSYDAGRLAVLLGEVSGLYPAHVADPLFGVDALGAGIEERGSLAAMDGTRSVEDLRRSGRLPPLELDRLLYAGISARLLELLPERRSLGPPPLPGRTEATSPSREEREDGEEALHLQDALPDDEERNVRERLLGTLAAMKRMDFFELLGVRQDARAEDVDRAYSELAGEYQLERFGRALSGETRSLAMQVKGLLEEARDTLLDAPRRQVYRQQLKSGGVKHEVGEEVGRMLHAESTFRRGEALLQTGDVSGAHALFREAAALQPEEGEFLAYLGWTTFQRSPRDGRVSAEALRILSEAVEKSPGLDRAHLFVGLVQKALGRTEHATRAFERAAECNPSCAEALHELSLLSWAARLSRGS